MIQKVKVLKRDGSLEDFEPAKVARIVRAAGLDEAQAKNLADKVATSVNQAEQDPVSSQLVGEKVLEELRKVDSNAASLFEWYGKTKQK